MAAVAVVAVVLRQVVVVVVPGQSLIVWDFWEVVAVVEAETVVVAATAVILRATYYM